MTRELTVFEILAIAEQMEREAARFYRKAAGIFRDPGISKLFSELAQWEKCHVQVFAEMRGLLAEPASRRGRTALDPAEVSRLGAPAAVFKEAGDPVQELTGNETRTEILRLALRKEHCAIGYYTSLTEFALGQNNLKTIRNIIEEEQRHVRILAQSLQQAADC